MLNGHNVFGVSSFLALFGLQRTFVVNWCTYNYYGVQVTNSIGIFAGSSIFWDL